ncbi:hypothetical protein EO244_12210 [Ancylomarina salipaludis]|uniref:Lipoprotein n=1 Tax=Ancylomarina salipaludis TaxID=2501299 RepID=A0A4Q1JKQ0_9BACT|nr:hypothetical protein [Ancylomarina salipaludis]RXQ91507.1 hypothetical protein EO244_12210 [Ancylomarina salipaludis]
MLRRKMNRIFCIVLLGLFTTTGCQNNVKTPKNTESYQSTVMLNLFSIETSNDFTIKIPETDTYCKLTQIISNDTIHLVKGDYTKGEVRGEVYIDYTKIVALNQSSGNETFLIIPFSVSNQGSGIFTYMGLFNLNNKSGLIKHLDSKFLGDRIKLESTEYDGNHLVQVKMKVHSKEQCLSQTPTEIKEMDFYIDRDKLKLTLI